MDPNEEKFLAAIEPEAAAVLPYQDNQQSLASIAVSLKRIADAMDSSEAGGKPQGSVLYWLEMLASAANAGRS